MLPCVTFSFMKNLLVSTFAKEDQSLGATRADNGEQTSPCSNGCGSRQNLPAIHHTHKI